MNARGVGLTLIVILACWAPAPAAGQAAGIDEVGMLADATSLEAGGDLAGAERVLLAILEARPGSGPALLALERVLQLQNRLRDLPAPAQAGVAEDPGSALLNQLVLRTYSALDQVEELDAAAAAWIAQAPGLETPYREVARTWVERGDYERARRTLEAGRRSLTADDALALELGSLYVTLGELDLAAAEFERAIGVDGRGISQVRRALRSRPDAGAGIIPRLVRRLEGDPVTGPRLAAAVELATGAGLEATAIRSAEQLAPMLDAAERRSFLIDLGRRADGTRLVGIARWAYGQLVRDGGDGELLAVQSRLAELAREDGDTTAAAAGYGTVEGEAVGATAMRRRAAALRIEVVAAQDPAEARQALRAFRDEYDEAPELDRVAALVAETVLSHEGREAAEQVLAGVRGPHTSLLRGRLALAGGDPERARGAFLSAAPALRGNEATQVLSLVALLGRVSHGGSTLLADVMTAAAAGDPGGAIDRLVDGARTLDARERAALLEFGAGLADAHDLAPDARALRRTLVADHPRSDEAPAALLALARGLGNEEREEARELLERLVVEYPRSALVPQARRELDRIGRAGNIRNSNHSTGK